MAEQLREGELYKQLNKTFSINLLSFDFCTESQVFHNRYRILNVETGKSDGKHDNFELHYLELRKFHKSYDELTTALDRWATFLTLAHKLDKRKLPEALARDPAIVKAVQAVDRMFDEDERQIYELRWKTYADEASRLDSALHKGLSQGREQGREECERAKAEAVARQLMAMGMPAAQISLATGLSEAEVGRLAGR